jgi:hypothetical protein
MNCINNNKLYLKNIFIIDWDDTLFPTTWISKNSINLDNLESVKDYKLYFIELDKTISIFLEKISNMCKNTINSGHIYIVTNANINWIKTCLNNLQLTKKNIIKNNIRIVSARDIYSPYSNSPTEWKINTFRDILNNIIMKMEDNQYGGSSNIMSNTFLNIISLGDANYEYLALINLDNYFKSNNKNVNYLLKSIKFMEKPSFDYIIDQIQVVNKNTNFIINKVGYIDLKFTPAKV